MHDRLTDLRQLGVGRLFFLQCLLEHLGRLAHSELLRKRNQRSLRRDFTVFHLVASDDQS